jgi:hypothetical protein
MRNWSGRFVRNEGAASALEFAILLPVFVTVLFGTLHFSIFLYQAGLAQYAVEEAARAVMVRQDLTMSEVEAEVRGRLGGLMVQPVAVTQAMDQAGEVNVLRVSVSFTMPLSIPFVPLPDIQFNAHAMVPITPEAP